MRLVQTTAADGGVTHFVLDAAGNRVGLIDPAGNETDWTVDALNRPVTETNSSGTTTTAYDPSSEITSITDADGRVRDFTHDNLHRLTAEDWMQGGTVIASMNYAYDSANELTSASDPNSAYAFSYNGDAQVTSVDNAGTPNVPHVVLASAYDPLGDRTSLSATINGTADFLNNYSYDADQNLTMAQQQQQSGGNTVSSKEIDYGYNAIGQISAMADFNFIGVGPRLDVLTGAYSYDNGARLTGIAYTSNGGADTLDTLGWGYDPANNVTSFTSIDGTAAYGYDPTNQLTSATYTTASGGHQPANENFSFDKNGNRTMSGYSTGGDNLLTSDGTFNYQHDANGNTTVGTRISNSYATDYRTTYSWDYRNRLTDVEYYDNNSVLTKHVHFVYGVFDHLIATEADTTGSGQYNSIQHYVLDVSPEIPSAGVPGTALAQPDLEFDGNETLIQRNLVALNPTALAAVIAQEDVLHGGGVTWMADDYLGSVVDIADNSGAEADHIVRAPFGQMAYESNSAAAPWAGFGGGHDDPYTGLLNDYHRWLNTADGKWLSADPSGFGAADMDLTRYALNSPTNGTDPTGLGYWSYFGSNYVYYGQNIWSGMAAGAANGALNGAAYGGAIGAITTGGPGLGPGMAVGGLMGGLYGMIAGGMAGMNANSPGQAAQYGYYYGGIYGAIGGGVGAIAGPANAAKAFAAFTAAERASQAAQLTNALAQVTSRRNWLLGTLGSMQGMQAQGYTLGPVAEQQMLARIAALNAEIALLQQELANF